MRQAPFDIQHDNPLPGRKENWEYKENPPLQEMGTGKIERNMSLSLESVFTFTIVFNIGRSIFKSINSIEFILIPDYIYLVFPLWITLLFL